MVQGRKMAGCLSRDYDKRQDSRHGGKEKRDTARWSNCIYIEMHMKETAM